MQLYKLVRSEGTLYDKNVHFKFVFTDAVKLLGYKARTSVQSINPELGLSSLRILSALVESIVEVEIT